MCSPDYNAYTQSENKKPNGARTTLRSAGFHIHLGYDNYNVDTSLALIRYMDMYIGVPSVVSDPDTNRRKLYGKAGSFRLTPYGLEYRSLSSYMMSNNDLLSQVWDGVVRSIIAYNEGTNLADSDLVQEAINTSNVELAKKLIDRYNL